MEKKGNVTVDMDWEKAKEQIFIAVANQKKEKELKLNKVPYRGWAGIVFFCMLRQEDEADAHFIAVDKYMARKWKRPLHDIVSQAVKNTKENSVMLSLEEVVMSLLLEEGITMPKRQPVMPMFVFTNQTKEFGAAGVFFGDQVQRLSEQLGANLFLLPSSVHEMILFPDYGIVSASELIQMVREINQQKVLEEERLSDDIFYYDRKQRAFYRGSDRRHP